MPPPQILAEGSLTSEEIDSKKLIDQHYYAIASKATILKPAELNVPEDKFKAQFGACRFPQWNYRMLHAHHCCNTSTVQCRC